MREFDSAFPGLSKNPWKVTEKSCGTYFRHISNDDLALVRQFIEGLRPCVVIKLEPILTLMKLPGVGPVRLRRAISVLSEAQMPIEEAFSENGRRLLTTMGLSPSSPQSMIGSVADQLRRDDVRCFVAPFHDLAITDLGEGNPLFAGGGPEGLLHDLNFLQRIVQLPLRPSLIADAIMAMRN